LRDRRQYWRIGGVIQGDSDVARIAQVIQLSVAPVFLMAGVSGLLNVLTNRLGRTIDRARLIEERLDKASGEERAAIEEEVRDRLQIFSKRARLVNYSITLCTACASLICLVIIALFSGAFLGVDFSWLIGLLFVLAMVSLFSALVCFLREILMATRSLRIGATTDPHLEK
jgi:hypothetical protein